MCDVCVLCVVVGCDFYWLLVYERIVDWVDGCDVVGDGVGGGYWC